MNAKGNGYRLPTHFEWEWIARGGPLSQNNHAMKTGSGPNTAAIVEEGQALEDRPLCQSGAELGVHLMSDTDWE
jgi:formylglycine-generating enzyme required for sulfatase activity